MPEEFQKIITVKFPLHVRQKPTGVYEARFRAHGYNISVSSVDESKLKPKFIEALKSYSRKQSEPQPQELPEEQTKSPLFNDVAGQWLELREPTIKPTTFQHYESLFRANIFPALEGRRIDELKQSDCQELINDYITQGKYRTATKIYQALKAIFDFAVGDELISKSPMRLLKAPKYEERNGIALTLEEERELIRRLSESKCASDVANALIFLLYTGIRRSELASACIEGEFISVICSKTRKGFQEKRRLIPITPMLAAWMHAFNIEKLCSVRPDALTQAMKRLMPEHHLHELRHTFITRCQECGVSREVVSVWAGHAADNTQTSNVYTHFSKEYMQREAQKVFYEV